MLKFAYCSALLCVAFAAVSPTQASTISCTTGCGSGGPYPLTWSVNVDSGVTLEAAYYLYDGSSPDGPSNQGNAVPPVVQSLPGLSNATLVDDGDLSSGGNAGSDSANVFALHFGGGPNSSYNDIVLVFSEATTLTDVTLQGLSNYRSFDAPSVAPLPATLPLFASGFGLVALIALRRKRKAEKATAAA